MEGPDLNRGKKMPRRKKMSMPMDQKACSCHMHSNNTWGLIGGIFLGGWHLIWIALVASGLAQVFIDWVFSLHMIRPPYVIAPFDGMMALTLVIVTFIVGYMAGWVFAAVCNAVCKK